MKSHILLLLVSFVLAGHNLFGQGQGVVTFSSVGAPDNKRIWGCNGAFASGTDYRVALYWGSATETDDRNLIQIGASTTFLTGASAGTYFGGGRTITTPGSTVNGPVLAFQVRAWTAAHGQTYEEALQNSAASLGKNAIFTLKTKDPNNVLEVTPNLWQASGYQGFQVGWPGCIPEPSSMAMIILGGVALLVLRRRTQ